MTLGPGTTNKIASLIISQIICIPFLKRPFQNLADPGYYDIENAENIRITVAPGESIGAWMMSPHNYSDDDLPTISEAARKCPEDPIVDNKRAFDAKDLEPGCPPPTESEAARERLEDTRKRTIIIVYAHGNSETRAQWHRVKLYRLYQRMGYYVLAFDYRGYGDSSLLSPNEETMTKDLETAVKYARSRGAKFPKRKQRVVIVHGHSLGTGVAVKAGANMARGRHRPDGYILEAPFNNMKDEINQFKVGQMAEKLIVVEDLLKETKMAFESDKNIKKIKEPIMIFHAEDDNTVPVELGHALFHKSRKENEQSYFVVFDGRKGLGHNLICMDPEFRNYVDAFIRRVLVNVGA